MENVRTYLKRARVYIKCGRPLVNSTVNIGIIEYGGCLKGRRILITGGSKGLGFAIAQKCLEEGAKVVITGRDAQALKKSIELLGGRNVWDMPFDIRQSNKASQLVEKAAEFMGGIDSVVSNAGISLHEKSWDSVGHEQWDTQMETNLKGTYFLAQAFFKYCENNSPEKGSFIIMSSERGLYGDDIPYGLSKAALIDLTIGLAKRASGTGIRVNAVAPGVTATEMTGHSPEGNLFRPYARGKRILLPEEIAETTVFLMSDLSECISGVVIPCNETNHLR